MSILHYFKALPASYKKLTNRLITLAENMVYDDYTLSLMRGIAIGLVIFLVMQGSSYVYILLAGSNDAVTPLLWLQTLWYASQNNHIPRLALLLTISLILPLGLVSWLWFAWNWGGFRWTFRTILVLACIWVWLLISDTLFKSVSYHAFINGSAIDFIRQWLFYYQDKSTAYHLLIDSAISAMIIAILWVSIAQRSVPNIYGQAHFATKAEIRQMKLTSKQGLLLGRAYGLDLYQPGYEHCTVFAPTGGQKTSAYVIPNLLTWEESGVFNDNKLTLFNKTSGYRSAMGQLCFLWAPTQEYTHCYNPLDLVPENKNRRIDEIQRIAHIFIPDNPKTEPIWIDQPRALFIALVLYVFDTQGLPRHIAQVLNLIKQTPNFSDWLLEVLTTREDLDPICREIFYKFLEIHPKTQTGLIFSLLGHFTLFDNPLIAAATSRSDFDIRDLRRKRMTVYVGFTSNNMVRLSPLMTVFYEQIFDVMTSKPPGQDEPYGVQIIMDEFASLKKMETFKKSIALFREYRLRVSIIVQELSQLYDTYGQEGAKTFINSKVRIAYTQTDEQSSKYLSSQLGTYTMRVKNVSNQQSRELLKAGVTTESEHYVKRELMLPQEIRLLPDDKAIILIEGKHPIYANKIPWFKDRRFKKKILPPINLPTIMPMVEEYMAQKQKVSLLYMKYLKEAFQSKGLVHKATDTDKVLENYQQEIVNQDKIEQDISDAF